MRSHLLLCILCFVLSKTAPTMELSTPGDAALVSVLVRFPRGGAAFPERLYVSRLLDAELEPHGDPHVFSAWVTAASWSRAKLEVGHRAVLQRREAVDRLASDLLPWPTTRRDLRYEESSCVLYVVLASLPSFRPAASLAHEWEQALRGGGAAAGALEVRAVSARKLRVTCGSCGDCVGRAARWIAAQEETDWVERARGVAARSRMAGAALEWGDPACSAARGAWRAAGLRGAGTVIGIVDSGVDLDHCMFADGPPPTPRERRARACAARRE